MQWAVCSAQPGPHCSIWSSSGFPYGRIDFDGGTWIGDHPPTDFVGLQDSTGLESLRIHFKALEASEDAGRSTLQERCAEPRA